MGVSLKVLRVLPHNRVDLISPQLKRDANLIFIVRYCLFMLFQLVLRKFLFLLLIIVPLRKLSYRMMRKGFGSGGKNGISRVSLHGTKLKTAFPRNCAGTWLS